MNGVKEYYNFCSRILNAALNGEKILITFESANIFFSGSFKVEPVSENESLFEIVAENATFSFSKNDKLSVEYDESEDQFIITDDGCRVVFT